MSSEETKTFTRAEVAKHNTNKDTWLLIHNSIYDVTAFLNEVRVAGNTSKLRLRSPSAADAPETEWGSAVLLGVIWVPFL